MAYEKSVHLLAGGAVMVECGPMRLVIDARVGKLAQPQQALRAADEAVRFLEGVARARPFLGRDYQGLTPQITDPLALKMVASIQAVGDEDLTPMAAVAGTIADAVADFLFERGLTRVLVDNGGDVAVRCCDGDPVAVGIRPNVESKSIAQVMVLGPERTAWGIATSGLGGRSLTRGVLEVATIVAADASLADAAATAVANASRVQDPTVVRKLAETIDGYTDIAGLEVTAAVGPLSVARKDLALSQALARAEELITKNVIYGAYAAVQGQTAMTRFIAERLRTTS
jgi:ApbE superfamily uncharacterized protein (UPF0280 family)